MPRLNITHPASTLERLVIGAGPELGSSQRGRPDAQKIFRLNHPGSRRGPGEVAQSPHQKH